MFRSKPTQIAKRLSIADPYTILRDTPVIIRDADARIKVTTSCRDTDYIPKVKNAGAIGNFKGHKVQYMHNGLAMVAGGYHGDWMATVIKTLKGHHEPQEEKVFYEILKRLPTGSSMIELGAFWAYYSLWFAKAVEGAKNICCEPDSTNLEVGRENAKINGFNPLFIRAAGGGRDGEVIEFIFDSDQSKTEQVEVRTVDSLLEENHINKLDVLHMDIQGVELQALKGAQKSIKGKRIRFAIVSTHHYFFSKDPLNHQRCLEFLIENGGHIICEHSPYESFSGDGLIAVSFNKEDEDFTVDVSYNRAANSLYRLPEEDIAILNDYIKKLVSEQ